MTSWLDIQDHLLDQIRINIDFDFFPFIKNLLCVINGLLAQNAFKCLKSVPFALVMMYLIIHHDKFANILHGLTIHGEKLTQFDQIFFFAKSVLFTHIIFSRLMLFLKNYCTQKVDLGHFVIANMSAKKCCTVCKNRLRIREVIRPNVTKVIFRSPSMLFVILSP